MFELVVGLPQALVDSVSDALIDEVGALAVSVEDADAGTDAERAQFDEPGMAPPQPGWERSTLRVLFEQEAQADAAASWLMAQRSLVDLSLQGLQQVPEQDWVRLTQAQFEPVPITDRFWVVPSWHQPPAQATLVMRLDPGLAFGTGTHPTTRMCLRWLAAQAPALAAQWSRVLDYGCGSGILAVGVALHGARGIDAVDIDPAALRATEFNARANAVELRVGRPEQASGTYPLVLANILAAPLTLLAPLLSSHVGAGGHLVLAGILHRQADALIDAYAPWMSLAVADMEDGWILMVAQRPADMP